MTSYAKLKTNLKLAVQRLKLLEKKKTEQSLKARKEIADYIAINKPDRARIRVEHIIREDNCVEALEILEMYCELLLARFGLIEKMKELDPGLDEAISTIIWASPRVSNEILEFKIIHDLLSQKYGKKYADACKTDAIGSVNEKVKKRLGFEAPPKLLVEQYLIEIAKNYNVKYTPDDSVMLKSGHMTEELIQLRDHVDEIQKRQNGGGGPGSGSGNSGGGGGAAAYIPPTPFYNPSQDQKQKPLGFNDFDSFSHSNGRNSSDLLDFGDEEPFNNNPLNNSHNNTVKPPPLPNTLPFGDVDPKKRSITPPPSYNKNLESFGKLNTNQTPSNNQASGKSRLPSGDDYGSPNAPPPPSKKNPNTSDEFGGAKNSFDMTGFDSPPPRYNTNDDDSDFASFKPPSKSTTTNFPSDDLGLPSVPDDLPISPNFKNNNNKESDSFDYDDLTKRFNNLKSK